MKNPFELICFQTYAGWQGLPVDLSDHESHGQSFGTDFLPDGATPGSGAVRFPTPHSRILIDKSPASKSVTGIIIEATVRLTRRLNRISTLVAGHNSFSFFLVEGQLRATFRGKSTHPLANSDGLDSDSDGVVFPRWTMPIGNRWLKLAFIHDGVDTMELYVDDQLIARRSGLLASVPPVGPLGISIGNEPDRDDSCFLGGDLDELKIWRLDPSIMDREFISRPMGDKVAECWKNFFRSLAEALRKHPDCAQKIDVMLKVMIDGLRRAIVTKGPETRDRYIKTCEHYEDLWRAGKLDGPAMSRLLSDWCAWLGLTGFSFKDEATVKSLLESDCLKKVLADLAYGALDCDPQFKAFLQHATQSGAHLDQRISKGEHHG